MKQILAVILLCCFSAMMITESFVVGLNDFSNMELLEMDFEGESEKDQKEQADEFLTEFLGLEIVLSSNKINLPVHLQGNSNTFSEITLPPPESV